MQFIQNFTYLSGMLLSCIIIWISQTTTNIAHCQANPNNDIENIIIDNLSPKVKPCDNFYEFACGTHERDFSREATRYNDLRLYELLQNENKYPLKEPNRNLARLRNYYLSCERVSAHRTSLLNLINKILPLFYRCRIPEYLRTKRDKQLLEFLLDDEMLPLSQWFSLDICSAPDMNHKFDWVHTISVMADRGISLDLLFKLRLHVPRDPYPGESKSKLRLKLKARKESKRDMDYYKEVLRNLIPESFDNNQENIEIHIKELIEFRDNLNQLWSRCHENDDQFEYISVEGLKKLSPDIDWISLLSGLTGKLITEDDFITVPHNCDWLIKFNQIMSNAKASQIGNHLLFGTIEDLAPLLSGPLYWSTSKRRQESCLDMIKKNFQPGLSFEFARTFIDKQTISEARRIVDSMKLELNEMIAELLWMSDQVKSRAKKLANQMLVWLSIADEPEFERLIEIYYDSIELDEDNLFENTLKLRQITRRRIFERLNNDKSEQIWRWTSFESSWSSSAQNWLNEHMVVVPAALLTGYHFNASRDLHYNLAIFGFALAHELAHSFDISAQRHSFDDETNQQSNGWWDEKTKSNYQVRSKCYVRQYASHLIPGSNACYVDGQATLIENLADVFGYRLARRTLDRMLRQTNSEPKYSSQLSNNFNQYQLFWLSAANFWCESLPDIEREKLFCEAEHSPNELRVRLPLSNLPEFGIDFKCKLGTQMNPRIKCTV